MPLGRQSVQRNTALFLQVLEYSCPRMRLAPLVEPAKVASAIAIRLLINFLMLDLGSSRGS